MREDRRRRALEKNNSGMKNILYITGTMIALGIIAFFVTVMIYNNNLDKVYSDLEAQQMAQMSQNQNVVNEVEETSLGLGRTVEQMEEELDKISDENRETNEVDKMENTVDTENTIDTKETSATVKETNEDNKKESDKIQEPAETQTQPEKEEVKEPTFTSPVDGEIVKEYAKDNLVYSETLKEWVTHMGIDIKADKTTVVKSAEDGKVTAIKNDPRYGTTVIVEHASGYETRYANLLTAEFVSVGEEISKGQTIGTVGDTGAFEILDEPHLHFEILKNGEYQDPKIYINY